ncbi:hypothetical protein CEXT_313181 [Caerostris extrusa]|uniref:Uncharacterized protein n=1 Tax=Caerostris extrusa TaxID=172846 RepID=A0AAV4UDA3_CAEEX|nr:hypothetical protein CEXT_313181 [Caerostris extrusa]
MQNQVYKTATPVSGEGVLRGAISLRQRPGKSRCRGQSVRSQSSGVVFQQTAKWRRQNDVNRVTQKQTLYAWLLRIKNFKETRTSLLLFMIPKLIMHKI